MARYKVKDASGQSYVITGADDATEDELQSALDAHLGGQPEKDRETTALEAAALGGAQGLTLGLSDEIYGVGGGLVDAVQGEGFNYSKNRDKARAALERARTDQPVAAYGGEIASGFLLPFGAARTGIMAARALPAGATLGARMGAGAREGAKWGAAYGFGSAEGGVGEQALGTAGGAALGGVFGGALPPVTDAARALTRGLGQGYRSIRNPVGVADEKLVESIARDAGDSTSVQGIQNALQQFDDRARLPSNAADPTLMVGDMGGQNFKGIIRAAADTPNDELQNFGRRLFKRQDRQWRRMEDAMARTVSNPDEYFQTVDDIVTRRKANADVDFARARAVPTPMTPALKNVIERPLVKELVSKSEDLQGLMDQPIGLETRTDMLHILKEHMDSLIDGYQKNWHSMAPDPTSGIKLKAWTQAKHDLLNAVDNPPYKFALHQYAGDSALKSAANRGYLTALKVAPEELADNISRMTPSERDMFRLGAARAMSKEIERSQSGINRGTFFKKPDIRKRVDVLWPDKASKLRFWRALERETKKSDTLREAYGGSKTNKYQKFSEDSGDAPTVAAEGIDMARSLISGNVTGLLRGASNFGKRFIGMSPEVSAAILRRAQTPVSQSSMSSLQPALEQISRRSNPQLYDPQLSQARGAFGAGYGSAMPIDDPDNPQ